MTYRVTIYCPDRHIVYDGRTPREKGVGGGITARVRLASALARTGHEVTAIVNCETEILVDNVRYLPLDSEGPTRADVLIANTSGGRLDLRPLLAENICAELTVLWVSSLRSPDGLHELGFDWAYAKSNFQSGHVAQEWPLDPSRLTVLYNGYDARIHTSAENSRLPRDPYALAFISHPTKGLDTAIAVTNIVRAKDPRFHLEVYGGPELWGSDPEASKAQDGVRFHGLVGQRTLARELCKTSFVLSLHSVPDTFGNAVVEAMRAGCILVASPVGAQAELVGHLRTGVLVPGSHSDPSVRDTAAKMILDLAGTPETTETIRSQAMAVPWSSDRMAEAWTGHWDWLLHAPTELWRISTEACPRCEGEQLSLADGAHCLKCSHYRALAIGEPAPVEGTA